MNRKLTSRALRLERRPGIGGEPRAESGDESASEAVVDCGWGRLIAGQTFSDPAAIAACLLEERSGQRDIAFYVDKPHVVVAQAPQQLFVDPSEAFRLWLSAYRPQTAVRRPFTLRRWRTRADLAAVNALYRGRGMVSVDAARLWRRRAERKLTYALAEDRVSGEILGVAMGVDHVEAFGDPGQGSSLWSLAVAPQAPHGGIGEALVRYLAEIFLARGRSFMDVSVLHDNSQAIALYEKLGFQRINVFAVKRRNAINELLFTGPLDDSVSDLNPYARIIVDEARRRGINVEVIDAPNGYFRLEFGGRSVICRESLTELTTAIAMSRCQDKAVTLKLLADADLSVPDQIPADDREAVAEFLARHAAVVVKPADGEQGKGIAVNLTTMDEVGDAIDAARAHGDRVIVEQFCAGLDLRIVVIDYRVVAAAVRRPPTVIGDGRSTIAQLIEKQSRRRAAATGGESSIPVDKETERCLASQGLALDAVPESERVILVRNTANLHTGGTIHDVTDELHPALVAAAERAARALAIPVTGLDFLVPAVDGEAYVIIEANERPGLANHEPQPTAERFVDLLFPRSRVAS
ncbi:MAG: N-acetylglutaminylglutamine synthetase [Rhodocyclaceae bacterium]|nr:N-acetylglutaminylglutamine synthetase [Rhodocyclaceae bacterium]